jgi:hypothetical protein
MENRKPLTCVAFVCAVLAFPAAACSAPATAPSDRETAWLALLRGWAGGLKPAQRLVTIAASGSAPRLTVRLSLPAGTAAAQHFTDNLYGAYAFAFANGRWRRVDTADFRAAQAKVLRPGQRATIVLPVTKATAYRILVQAARSAAWADYRPRTS